MLNNGMINQFFSCSDYYKQLIIVTYQYNTYINMPKYQYNTMPINIIFIRLSYFILFVFKLYFKFICMLICMNLLKFTIIFYRLLYIKSFIDYYIYFFIYKCIS